MITPRQPDGLPVSLQPIRKRGMLQMNHESQTEAYG
ncbi:hypothetical protein THITH_13430 [Thioalkalivibrio paradoxus ARh 1]|uniref:Uncharacterized protein n=1 Tax=Thioalkalivibrio paradoxus ARh 1 TaxID=713585 RepID=W0DTQ5_9GAMM|nr:hypothetical protein THITH_13430 [Thioalkalivibrio paradoxus ARh 1]